MKRSLVVAFWRRGFSVGILFQGIDEFRTALEDGTVKDILESHHGAYSGEYGTDPFPCWYRPELTVYGWIYSQDPDSIVDWIRPGRHNTYLTHIEREGWICYAN